MGYNCTLRYLKPLSLGSPAPAQVTQTTSAACTTMYHFQQSETVLNSLQGASHLYSFKKFILVADASDKGMTEADLQELALGGALQLAVLAFVGGRQLTGVLLLLRQLLQLALVPQVQVLHLRQSAIEYLFNRMKSSNRKRRCKCYN